MVGVNWRPGPPIWQRIGLDPDQDPKWWSGTVANITQTQCHFIRTTHCEQLLRTNPPRLASTTTRYPTIRNKWWVASGKWQVASGKWHVVRGEMCIVTYEWQDESTCMSICVWVYLLTQCISNSQCIWANSARVDWSKAVQASSVQVPKNWGLVRSRSKMFLDWTWTRLDGSSLDWWNHCHSPMNKDLPCVYATIYTNTKCWSEWVSWL